MGVALIMEVALIMGVHLTMEVHLLIDTMEITTMTIRKNTLSQMCPVLNLTLQDLRNSQISLSGLAMVL